MSKIYIDQNNSQINSFEKNIKEHDFITLSDNFFMLNITMFKQYELLLQHTFTGCDVEQVVKDANNNYQHLGRRFVFNFCTLEQFIDVIENTECYFLIHWTVLQRILMNQIDELFHHVLKQHDENSLKIQQEINSFIKKTHRQDSCSVSGQYSYILSNPAKILLPIVYLFEFIISEDKYKENFPGYDRYYEKIKECGMNSDYFVCSESPFEIDGSINPDKKCNHADSYIWQQLCLNYIKGVSNIFNNIIKDQQQNMERRLYSSISQWMFKQTDVFIRNNNFNNLQEIIDVKDRKEPYNPTPSLDKVLFLQNTVRFTSIQSQSRVDAKIKIQNCYQNVQQPHLIKKIINQGGDIFKTDPKDDSYWDCMNCIINHSDYYKQYTFIYKPQTLGNHFTNLWNICFIHYREDTSAKNKQTYKLANINQQNKFKKNVHNITGLDDPYFAKIINQYYTITDFYVNSKSEIYPLYFYDGGIKTLSETYYLIQCGKEKLKEKYPFIEQYQMNDSTTKEEMANDALLSSSWIECFDQRTFFLNNHNSINQIFNERYKTEITHCPQCSCESRIPQSIEEIQTIIVTYQSLSLLSDSVLTLLQKVETQFLSIGNHISFATGNIDEQILNQYQLNAQEIKEVITEQIPRAIMLQCQELLKERVVRINYDIFTNEHHDYQKSTYIQQTFKQRYGSVTVDLHDYTDSVLYVTGYLLEQIINKSLPDYHKVNATEFLQF